MKKQIAALLTAVQLVALFAAPALAQAQAAPGGQQQTTVTRQQGAPAANSGVTNETIANNICRGILSTETGTIDSGATADSCAQAGDKSFLGLTRRIINTFSVVVGAVSVIMIIIGGFRYIISGGDSTGVTSAKNTILYAIVGLVIVLFSQVIVRFILTNVAVK